MIKDYPPNRRFNDKHKVLIKLQDWEYKAEFIVEMENNLRGMDVINYALEKLDLGFYKEMGERYELEFKDDEGNTLLVSDDDDEGEDWLKQYLVGCEILEFTSGDSHD